MSNKILYAAFLYFGALFVTNANDIPIESKVVYDNGQWVGMYKCQFSNESACALSVHILGRRIDVDNHLDDESVFVSCVSSDISIALTIANFSYDNVEDYTCLEDSTQESYNNWLLAYPDLQVQGLEAVGAQVKLTCNSFLEAPLYWVLPGSTEDNANVVIVDYVNENNGSTSAAFKLKNSDNYAEYKCCIEAKSNQNTDIPCSSYTFILDDSLELIETYENYRSENALNMQCIFRGNPTPEANDIQWRQCSAAECEIVYTSYITNVIDEKKHTLNSSLKISYSSSNDYYVCSLGNLSHTFNVNTSVYAPEVVPLTKQIFYSTDGYAVTLGCRITGSPQPEIYWTKSLVNTESKGATVIESGGSYIIQNEEIAENEWQTNFVIFPYDANADNALYTCVANNSYGQRTIKISTTDGPNSFSLTMSANYNNSYNSSAGNVVKGICTFQMFPYPPTYEMTVLSASDIPYNTTVSQNEELSQVTVTVAFTGNKAYYPVTVDCTAFNRFNQEEQYYKRFVVNTNNFTAINPYTSVL